MTYKDPSGKQLSDYPQPSVAVDAALLTVTPEHTLAVLVIEDEELCLPGTFVHQGERIHQALERGLLTKTGLTHIPVRQLQLFDRPDRDNRGWVMSVAHLGALPYSSVSTALADNNLMLLNVDDKQARSLKYDHAEIIDAAVRELRSIYEQQPDPYNLLEREEFTLLQLMDLHRTVAGGNAPLLKDTFRRRMSAQLEETGEMSEGTVGKPAKLYRRPARRP